MLEWFLEERKIALKFKEILTFLVSSNIIEQPQIKHVKHNSSDTIYWLSNYYTTIMISGEANDQMQLTRLLPNKL